jgi:hypothetical protein
VFLAVGVVLCLSLILVVAIADSQSLSAGIRWLLLLLALVADTLAALQQQGTA